MAIRMQQRRATAEQWNSANPVLGDGEIGFETDTGKFKIGNGVNNWDELYYFLDEESFGGSLEDYVPLTQKGANNGIAELDGTGNVPLSQLGNLPATDLTDYATVTYVTTTVNNIDLSSKQDVVANVSSTEIGYLDGVSSGIQSQLNNKANSSHTHVIADITDYVDPNFNLDGGKANSEYSGIISIDGGNAGSF
jgi:hypothetical protein